MKDNWLVGAHILMLFMLSMWLKLYSQLFLQLYPCSHELKKITTTARKNSPLGYDFEVTGQALWSPISFISPHSSLLGEVRPWRSHSFFFFFVFCSNTNAPGSGCILILISSLCLTVSEFARPFWWEGQKHEDARRLKRAGCCWEEECMQEVEPKISRKNVDNR